MKSADDFRETALLVAQSQQMVAAAREASIRAALASDEIRKKIDESLELIEAAKKLRKINSAIVAE